SAQAFLDHAGPRSGGCVILDFHMPGLNGLELQELLLDRGTEWQIVFLTGRAEIPQSVQAMKHGAVDFLVKPARGPAILAAVERALLRHDEWAFESARHEDVARRIEGLSPRERQVLGHVIAGRLNKQIADALGTAEK